MENKIGHRRLADASGRGTNSNTTTTTTTSQPRILTNTSTSSTTIVVVIPPKAAVSHRDTHEEGVADVSPM
eukprot:3938136-Rhodomonas_salina.2